MAIGLKMSGVKKFGQKLAKGAAMVGRKLAKGAEAAGSVLTPIATAINPELGAGVAAGVEAIKKAGRTTERLGGKASSGLEKGFRTLQQPVLGAREIVRAAKGAMDNPAATQIRIGDVIANRFQKKKSAGIQREGEAMNDWAPDLPFAGM